MVGFATPNRYMSVREVAEYLHLNEKKIYLLASEGKIPATKITGKWIFPRELVDQWILSSSHNGLLTDKLIISGCDDPVLPRAIHRVTTNIGASAFISYSYTGVKLGLKLLQRNKIDVCCMRWGPESESDIRHPAYIQRFEQHQDWILVRGFSRQQGLIVSNKLDLHGTEPAALVRDDIRWALREDVSGAQRIFNEQCSSYSIDASSINSLAIASSERMAASLVAMDTVDVAPGSRGSAVEFGLQFLPLCRENVDLVMRRRTYFRKLLQTFIESLTPFHDPRDADSFSGYDLRDAGRIIWCHDEY